MSFPEVEALELGWPLRKLLANGTPPHTTASLRRNFNGDSAFSELRLSGDECLLDAGCGTGELTRILLQNLPSGRATPDQSPSAHRLSNPLQVRRAPIFNANLNTLRKLVGMQVTQRLAHAIEGG